jgi:hypothetical protein
VGLGWTGVPEMMFFFGRMKKVIDTTEEFRVLDAINEAMLRRNFSSHRLQRTPEQFAVLEMRNVLWND